MISREAGIRQPELLLLNFSLLTTTTTTNSWAPPWISQCFLTLSMVHGVTAFLQLCFFEYA